MCGRIWGVNNRQSCVPFPISIHGNPQTSHWKMIHEVCAGLHAGDAGRNGEEHGGKAVNGCPTSNIL